MKIFKSTVVGDSKFSKSYKVTTVTEVPGVVGDSKFYKSYNVAGVAEDVCREVCGTKFQSFKVFGKCSQKSREKKL